MLSRLALALLLLSAPVFAQTRQPARSNPLAGDPDMVDRLVFLDTEQAFREGTRRNVALVTGATPRLVLLDANPDSFPRDGRWTSAVVETEFPFTEFLPSWNADAPPDTGIRFEARVREAATGIWSPWLHLGQWGRAPTPPVRTVAYENGVVNVDVLNLERPANAFQVRADFRSVNLDTEVNPALRRVAVCYSGVIADPARRARLRPPVDLTGLAWARTLEIPHLGQATAGRPLSGQICSPTSVTMVLSALGVDRPIIENAMAIWDPDYEIFGNWGRAVAYAGQLGFDAWLTRVRSWDEAKRLIAEGQPIIASISVGRGDLTGIDYTGGHLVVIRGFTPEGDPVINDPAFSDPRGDGAVHSAREFAHVWFDHGGVAYIIRPRAPLAAH